MPVWLAGMVVVGVLEIDHRGRRRLNKAGERSRED
jgi:hypothetical protein